MCAQKLEIRRLPFRSTCLEPGKNLALKNLLGQNLPVRPPLCKNLFIPNLKRVTLEETYGLQIELVYLFQ